MAGTDEEKRLAYNAYQREYRKGEKWREWYKGYKERTRGLPKKQYKYPVSDEQRDRNRIAAHERYCTNDEYKQKKKLQENARYANDDAYRAQKQQRARDRYTQIRKHGIPPFMTWLEQQEQRQDNVGRFARDVAVDPAAPKSCRIATWRRYLKTMWADDWAVEGCDGAFAEYDAIIQRVVGLKIAESPRRC